MNVSNQINIIPQNQQLQKDIANKQAKKNKKIQKAFQSIDMKKYEAPTSTALQYVYEDEEGRKNISKNQMSLHFFGITTIAYLGKVLIFGPAATAVGTLFDAGVAVTAGAVGAVAIQGIKISVNIPNLEDYKAWQLGNVDGANYDIQKLSDIFDKFVSKDPMLKDLRCIISQCLPLYPVTAPDGVLYDYDQIVTFIRVKPINTSASAIRNGTFKESDLHLDLDVCLRIQTRINSLIDNDFSLLNMKKTQNTKSRLIRLVLKNRQKHHSNLNKEVYEKIRKRADDKCKKDRLDEENKLEKLNKNFSSIKVLKKHINIFNKYMKPIARDLKQEFIPKT